jgi:Ca2+-binding EF-hand superfamily protein
MTHRQGESQMLTNPQLKRLPKMFAVNDQNGDGVVTQEDYEAAVISLAGFRGLAPGTSEYEDLHAKMLAHWNDLREKVDIDRDNRVTLEEWLAYWDKVLATEGEYERISRPLSHVVFQTLDRNSDNQISLDEYTQWLSQWAIDEKVAADCFARLDLNKDGRITADEWAEVVRDFFQSKDSSSLGNWLLGPPEV